MKDNICRIKSSTATTTIRSVSVAHWTPVWSRLAYFDGVERMEEASESAQDAASRMVSNERCQSHVTVASDVSSYEKKIVLPLPLRITITMSLAITISITNKHNICSDI